MIYTAENEQLMIKVNSLGAELCSIVDKETGREYMWSGDAKHWSGISPILFPFIGGLQGGSYRYDGTEYQISKHGFARRMEFSYIQKEEGKAAEGLWFSLEDTEETRKEYPFAFRLETGFVLEGRSVRVLWRVSNLNKRTMYFALGGHPAFACPPAYQQGDRKGCSIRFGGKEKIMSSVIGADGLMSEERKEYTLKDGLLPVTTGIFDRDAIILDDSQVDEVSLCDESGKAFVTVKFPTTSVGVWSKPEDDASFICIEPWFGRCDNSGYQGSLETRLWNLSTEAGERFESGYEICIA